MFYKKELLAIPIAKPKAIKKGTYFHCQIVDYHKKKLLVITVQEREEIIQRIFIDGEKWINYFPQKDKWNNRQSKDGIGYYYEDSFSICDSLNYTDANSLAVLDEFFENKITLNGHLEKIGQIQAREHLKKQSNKADKNSKKRTGINNLIFSFKFPQSLEQEKIKIKYFKDGLFKWKTSEETEVYCTNCKTTFGVIDYNGVQTCPCCGNKKWAQAVKKSREITTDTSVTEFFQNKGVVYAVVYRIERTYSFVKKGKFLKDGFVVRESMRSFPREIYIFDKEKTITAASWYSHNYMYGNKYWLEGGEWDFKPWFIEYASLNHIIPPSPSILKGTIFEHSHFEKICKISNISLLKYFHIFTKYPNIENLVTNRFDRIVQDIINNNLGKKNINLKRAKVNEILEINRDEQKRAKAENWGTQRLLVYKSYKKQGKILNEDTLRDISNLFYEAKDKVDILSNYRLGFYLLKQKKKDNMDVAYYYKDYIDMAKEMGYDLSNEKILYPPYLASAHDSLVRKLKYKPDSKRNKKYTEIKKALQEFEVSYNGLCLRIPNDDYDLFLEGKILDHCVGGEGFMNGHTEGRCIFFIRSAETDTTPFYTLNFNINTGEQLQLHGYNNDRRSSIPQAVYEFISWWKDNVFRKFDVGKMEFLEKPKKDKKGKRTEKKAA